MTASAKRPGPDARKKQILEAAVEVFGGRGYHGATTAEIARRAGVSSRLLFFYFQNKKELFRAAVKACWEDVMQAAARGNPPTDDIKTFIKMSMRNFVDFLHASPMKVKLILNGLDVVDDPEMKEDFRLMLDGLYTYIHSFLEDARTRGEISEDVLLDTVTLDTIGLLVSVSFAEFFGLNWFGTKDEFIFSIGDHFVDSVTRRA
jgi:AcrR family transcriptional regulator